MSTSGLYLFAMTLACIASQRLTLANYQQPSDNTDNVYQREHSLVKPYQGTGMVSDQQFLILKLNL